MPAVLNTLKESTKPMRDEVMAVGMYRHELLNRDTPQMQIVTIQEMIEEGKRIELPLSLEVLKSAALAKTDDQPPPALESTVLRTAPSIVRNSATKQAKLVYLRPSKAIKCATGRY